MEIGAAACRVARPPARPRIARLCAHILRGNLPNLPVPEFTRRIAPGWAAIARPRTMLQNSLITSALPGAHMALGR
jgi:hypothetical protein